MKLHPNRNLLYSITVIILIKTNSSVIIANSKLEICTNTSNPKSINNNDNKNSNSTFSLNTNEEQSNINNNYNNNNNLTTLRCKEKIIVSLAIDNSKSADTDYLEAFIHEVDLPSQTNPTLNSNNANTKKKLLNPIRINISKSPVYVEYPSFYVQTFNHKPTEQVIISDLFSCEDGDLAQRPTCGWTLNSLNQRIPYSQGFCCKCDFAQIIGINNTDRNRGNTCKFLGLGTGSATAHCLKYDALWWNAYEVSGYQLVYEISIFVSYLDRKENENRFEDRKDKGFERNKILNEGKGDARSMKEAEQKQIELQNKERSGLKNNIRFLNVEYSANSSYPLDLNETQLLSALNKNQNSTLITNQNQTQNLISKKITLSPSTRINASQDSKVIARLIGDFLPSSSISDFSNYFLLIPSYPESHPMVVQGPLNWILIPREQFTLDGRDCNRIGVSYSAFRAQQNKCLMRIGECLNNQIADFLMRDLDRVSNGKAANHIISQAKYMNGAEPSFYSFSGGQTKKLTFKLSGVFNSLVSLEIAADDLKYVVNISQAKIDFLKIEVFENNSKNGIMRLQLTNTGSLSAEFTLGFTCSEFVLPLGGERLSLKAFESKSLQKSVFTSNSDEDFKKFNSTFKHECMVKAMDFNGNAVDEKTVLFNTTKIEEVNIQLPMNSTTEKDKENSSAGGQGLINNEKVQLECSLLCPDFFGFLCFVVHGCWGFFARTALILLALLGLVALLIRAVKNGTLLSCLKKLLLCIWPPKRTEKQKREYNNNNVDLDFADFENNKNRKRNSFNCAVADNSKILNFKKQKNFENQKNNNDNYKDNDNDFHHDAAYKSESKPFKGKMFLNFSNVNFDFSLAGLFHNFSVEVLVFYHLRNRKISIQEVNFPSNFIAYCDKFCISDALEFSLLKNKIKFLPNFLTKMPLYSLFR